jgi:hypothetical protein
MYQGPNIDGTAGYNWPPTGGSGMDPLTIASLVTSAAQGFMGSGDPGPQANTHITNRRQSRMWEYMAKMLGQRAGDFGGGQAFKSGMGNLEQIMAQRGISPQSGAYAGAVGNVAGQAGVADQQNYQNAMFRLLGTPLQTHQSSGPNMVRTSQTYGSTPSAQFAGANALGRRFADQPWYA